MITVIIAGGSGSRLWPLSTNSYPKHLLQLVDDETLLQATYRRAKRLSDTVYVATGIDHLHHIKENLPDLTEEAFIVEPDRRDTAGCFVLALHHIYSRHNNDEPVAFISADHYIRDIDGFVRSFKTAEMVSKEKNRIALVGVEPTYAATGFGYIQKDAGAPMPAVVYDVLSFKEKPDFETAKGYLKSGHYLWNAGYFIGSVNTFLRAMEQNAPDLKANFDKILKTTDRASYEETFLGFTKVSIDYALIEKTKDLLVVPAAFDWIDIGSFGDAHKVSDVDEQRNAIKGPGRIELDGVTNSYIRNEEDKPVAVLGLDDVAVVNTTHGVLVMRKDMSQNVKKIVERLSVK